MGGVRICHLPYGQNLRTFADVLCEWISSFPATAECDVVDGEAEEEEVEEGSIPGDEDEGEDSCSTLIFLKALSAAKQIMAIEEDICSGPRSLRL